MTCSGEFSSKLQDSLLARKGWPLRSLSVTVTSYVPEGIDFIYDTEVAVGDVFNDSNEKKLKGLRDFDGRSKVVAATAALATMETAFSGDLKLSGVPLETFPDLEEKFKKFQQVLNTGRKCVTARACLEAIMSDSKDGTFLILLS